MPIPHRCHAAPLSSATGSGTSSLTTGVVVIVPAALAERFVQVGPPLRGAHQAGLDQREPVEEPGDAGPAAPDERGVPVQVLGHAEQPLGRVRVGLVGHVTQGQVAARRHRVPELPDDLPRVLVIPQAVQHAHEHDPDRLAEVEQAAHLRVAEHLPRFAQIRAERDDIGAGHQRGGMAGHERIDVHVDDPCPGRRPVDDLVGIGHVRQPGAEIEELADALPEHVVDHPLEQVAAFHGGVGTGRHPQPPDHRIGRVGRLPVHREVVLAAELVVPDTGRIGIADADRVIGVQSGRRRLLGGHRASSSVRRKGHP